MSKLYFFCSLMFALLSIVTIAATQPHAILDEMLSSNQQADHTVWNMLRDPEGSIHLLYSKIYFERENRGWRYLYYSKIDKSGNLISDERIRPQNFVLEESHLILNASGEAIVVVRDMYSSEYLQFNIYGKLMKRIAGVPAGGICFGEKGGISLFNGYQLALINPSGDLISNDIKAQKRFYFATGSSVQHVGQDSYLIVWRTPPIDNKTGEPLISYAMVDADGNPTKPETMVNLKEYAEEFVAGIGFQPSPVLMKSDDGLLLFIGEPDGVYRLRFTPSGELVKNTNVNPIQLLSFSEFSRRGHEIRLGKMPTHYTEKEAGAFFYGFTSDGNMYYEKSSGKLKVQR